MSLEIFPVLWTSLKSIGILSLEVWWNSAADPASPELFFFVRDYCCYSLIAHQRSIYLHFLVSILVGHISLEIYPFLLNFPIYDILKMSLIDSPDALSIVMYLLLHFIFLLINLVTGLSSFVFLFEKLVPLTHCFSLFPWSLSS